MSQPPSPFERSYSFTDFSINTPNLQQPGNKIDQELNNVRTSLNATISRLGEVQNDDGSVKVGSVDVASIIAQVSGPVALDRMLAESAKNDAVLKAAEVDAAKTYVTNVADGLVPAVQMILQNAQDVLAPAAESAFNAEQFSISANQSALAASESYSLSNIARNDAAIAASQAISAAASAAISAASAPAIPTGGSAGQVLSKIDSTNYNTQWVDASSGTADALPLAGGTMNTGSNIGFGIPGNEEWSILDLNGLFVTNTDGEKASNINGSNISQYDGSYGDSLAILNGHSGLEFFNWYDKSEVYAKYRPTGITFADGTIQTTSSTDWKFGGTMNNNTSININNDDYYSLHLGEFQNSFGDNTFGLKVGNNNGYAYFGNGDFRSWSGSNDENDAPDRFILNAGGIACINGDTESYVSLNNFTGLTFPDGTTQTTASTDWKIGGTLNDYAEIKLRKPYVEDEADGITLIKPNYFEIGFDTGYPDDEWGPLYKTTISGDTISQYEDADFNHSTYSSKGWSVASGALIGDISGITFPDSTIQTTAAILPPNDLDDLAQAYNNNGVWTNSPTFLNINAFGNIYVDNDLVLNAGTPAVIRFDDGGFEFRKTNIKFPDGSTQASAFIPSNYLTASSIASTYLSQSSAASTYYTKPTGTTGQYIRGDGSFATYSSGDKYLTSSTTSLTISNGSKTLTIGTGLSYSTQQDVTIAYDSSNHMHATVTSYNSSTGVIVCDVYNKAGSGTYAAWTVNVGGVQGGSYLQISNNLSDLTSASTARTNLGLAYATNAQSNAGTSASTVLTPSNSLWTSMSPAFHNAFANNATTSNSSGGGGSQVSDAWGLRNFTGTTASSYSSIKNGATTSYATSRGQPNGNLDWSKIIIFSGTCLVNQFIANCTCRAGFGVTSSHLNTDLSSKGIGYRIVGTGAVELQIHNGTTLYNVTSTFTPTSNTAFDFVIYSDGVGNATLYINDNSVAISSNAPTGGGSNTYNCFFCETDISANVSSQVIHGIGNPKIYIGR